ncbi:MAG: phytanoyl-CoA dioxygenase [Bacteroidetes bacterium]|nr:MAG: phytanoyl-CoA dioxygenase [Bacteroidota bacterium]
MSTIQIQLPSLDSYMSVSENQVKDFQTNGHTITPGVLSPDEIAAYRNVIAAAAEKYNTEKRKMSDRDTYGKAFLQIMNLWRSDGLVKKFVLSKRFAKIAAALMGVKNVRLYHDQALFKEPGGGHTPWHQDQYYWPIDTTNTITMWMPLVDISVEMGMLTFASGSHKKGSVMDYEISDKSEEAFERYVKEEGFEISQPQTMRAGDASWHYGFAIHSAPGNQSSKMREVMTIIYVADGAKVTQPKNDYQVNDHRTWLLGKPVGEIIDSELNPLLL